MHNAIVKILKYLLWTVFWLILIFLLVWLAKSHRNIPTYISLLNHQTISDFKWFSVFQSKSDNPWQIKSLWTWDSIKSWFETGEQLDDSNTSWLDVYDPQFEQDMQDASLDSILSWETEDYWFKNDSTWTSIKPVTQQPLNQNTQTQQQKLMELLKQNEMKK